MAENWGEKFSLLLKAPKLAKSDKKAFIPLVDIHQTVPKSFECDTLQLVDSSQST